MSGEWQDTTVGDIASPARNSLVGGPFGSNLVSRDYRDDGVPVIRGQNMDQRWIAGDFVYVTPDKADTLKANLARPGDIVFTQRGTLGQVSLVPEGPYPLYLVSQSQMKLTVDAAKADPLFIYYACRGPRQREFIRQNAIQTGVPHINLSILRGLPIRLPPLGEQRAIAQILGALDDKIELNRQMNETMESTVRALFKSWFVDFHYVHAKANGRGLKLLKHLAVLFPDSLESSGLREIPSGWRRGTLADIAENPRRTVQPSKLDPTVPYIGLGHMPQRSVALARWGCAEELESSKFEFRQGEILFGKLRSYFHKVGLAPVDGVCSTDILVLRPKDSIWLGFVLCHVASDEFIAYTHSGATGTRMPRTTWQEMARYELILPPTQVIAKYNDYVRPFTEHIIVNIHEARTLTSLHEALLPKLVSGELRIQDAERIVGRHV